MDAALLGGLMLMASWTSSRAAARSIVSVDKDAGQATANFVAAGIGDGFVLEQADRMTGSASWFGV
ncbi:hypothetical protein XH94_30440 [Bradyrhizobium zhanjiangense]|uniref:Uncharacterized protein n=1 Tax=Bradyrhizobium zhanjiangense TaxID=1325107 RepID=A0A4V1L2P9_9BRAD|nr:hypothetical protein XH94_30440 [Bradyrhizobium zhanjiangense]